MPSRPKCDILELLQAFRALVGRAYRVVHELDQVPSLPPTSQYRHVGFGIWLHDNQTLLEERPQYDLDDLNWNDHAFYSYYSGLQSTPTVTIPPNVTGAIPAVSDDVATGGRR